MIAGLVTLIFIFAVVGVLFWGGWRLINKVQMPDWVRTIIVVIATLIVIAVVWTYFPLSLLPSGPHRL